MKAARIALCALASSDAVLFAVAGVEAAAGGSWLGFLGWLALALVALALALFWWALIKQPVSR